jgi:hypothetical protein
MDRDEEIVSCDASITASLVDGKDVHDHDGTAEKFLLI